MTAKKPQLELDNLSQPYRINVVIDGKKRTNLIISYHRERKHIDN